MKHTVYAGVFAGSILALVYIMLNLYGSAAPCVRCAGNGAWTLRQIVSQLFGDLELLFWQLFSLLPALPPAWD